MILCMIINHWSYKRNHWLHGRCKSFEEESEEQEKDRILGNAYSEGQEREEEFSQIFQDLTSLSLKLLAFKLKKKNLSPVDYSWNVQGGIEMQSYWGVEKDGVILIYFPSCYSGNSMNMFWTNNSSCLPRNEFLMLIGF